MSAVAGGGPKSVQLVSDVGLCVSCLACGFVCPEGAITYEIVAGARRPKVDERVCTSCRKCVKVCPAAHLPGCDATTRPDLTWILADHRACYAGWATDATVRDTSISGGVASAVLLSLLESPDWDRIFALTYAGVPGSQADLAEVTSRDDVLAAASSKYIPPGTAGVLEALSEPNARVVVVATPCVLQAILSYMKLKRIARKRLLAIGLVCDRTLSPRALDHLAWKHTAPSARIAGIAYRTKRVGGWPGGVEIAVVGQGPLAVGRDARIELKPHYQLRRCTVCADKLNREADLVLGDCYVPGLETARGTSTVIVRTVAGEKALAMCGASVDLEPVGFDEVASSQGVSAKVASLAGAAETSRTVGLDVSWELPEDEATAARAQLEPVWADIARAETSPPAEVAKVIASRRWRGRFARVGAQAELALAFLWTLGRSLLHYRPERVPGDVSSIVVIGAGFGNRGAQAMLFAAMDAVRSGFPDADVYVAYPTELPGAEERFRVKVLPWTFGMKASLAGWPLSKNAQERFGGSEQADAVAAVLKDSAAFLDVSGYKLSSEFGMKESLDYCVNLLVGRILGIPYYVLPQSFGPFRYGILKDIALGPFLWRSLRGAARIWAREESGFRRVKWLAPDRLGMAPDIVLAHPSRSLEHIYADAQGPRALSVPQPSACIVPSMHIAIRQADDDIERFYAAIVERIAASGRHVVLLAHSAEDHQLCRRIARGAGVGADVLTIADPDLDAIEIEQLIGAMDFLVASRYHSMVHAYRCGVPGVILGWADKYVSLAALVHQERFVLDAKAGVDEVLARVDELIGGHEKEHEIISAALDEGFCDALAMVVSEL